MCIVILSGGGIVAVLNVRNLTMTFIENNLFTNVSFDLEEKEKAGLIGANGVGKTTIFKIINGEIAPTAGEIYISRNAKTGYMEQHACTHPKRTVYHELLSVFDHLKEMEQQIETVSARIDQNPENINELINEQAHLVEAYNDKGGLVYESRVKATLAGLGFSEADFAMETGKLSGGQRSKLSLAKLLLTDTDLLLLDEPTNHLDIESVTWLEGFIKEFKGAVLIISHDRYFLDAVTNKTIEIEHNKATCYTGSYSEYIIKKEQVNEALVKKYNTDLKEIDRVEKIIEQQKRWGRERNFITAESKQKQVDKLKEQLVVPDSELDTIKIRFSPKRESGNDVLLCENLSKSFGEKAIFRNVGMHIRKGEKVFIIGANGCGKTTLFKVLTGQYPPDSGEIKFGAKVDVGYFDQMQATLSLEKSAYNEVWDAFPHLSQTQVRTALGSFLFKGDDVFKPLSKMSGGERARVSLLKLMLSGDNFLLLDEPTNHLDTASRENLEQTLTDYDDTLLIISHDRYFINKLAHRILVLTPSGLKEYLGNYDYYLEKAKTEPNITEHNASENKSPENPAPKANDYKLRKEQQAMERKRQSRLKRTEETIEQLEQEIADTETLLQGETVTSDYEKLLELTQTLETLNTRLKEAYTLWEALENQSVEL